VTYFNFYRHLPGGTEGNHKTVGQDIRPPGRDLNPEHSGYEAGIQPLERDVRSLSTY